MEFFNHISKTLLVNNNYKKKKFRQTVMSSNYVYHIFQKNNAHPHQPPGKCETPRKEIGAGVGWEVGNHPHSNLRHGSDLARSSRYLHEGHCRHCCCPPSFRGSPDWRRLPLPKSLPHSPCSGCRFLHSRGGRHPLESTGLYEQSLH